jgi:MFS family permease
VIFLAFLATAVPDQGREIPGQRKQAREGRSGGWALDPRQAACVAMLATGMLLMFRQHVDRADHHRLCRAAGRGPAKVTMISGVVMSAAALGAILSASRLGKLADRIGHWNVIIGALGVAGAAADPAGLRHQSWQLIGPALPDGPGAGRAPALHLQRHPPQCARQRGGKHARLSISSQYVGQVAGPVLGGFRRRPYRHARGFSRHVRLDGGRRGV